MARWGMPAPLGNRATTRVIIGLRPATLDIAFCNGQHPPSSDLTFLPLQHSKKDSTRNAQTTKHMVRERLHFPLPKRNAPSFVVRVNLSLGGQPLGSTLSRLGVSYL